MMHNYEQPSTQRILPHKRVKNRKHKQAIISFGKELVTWAFFSIVAMALATPLCFWLNLEDRDNFFHSIKSLIFTRDNKIIESENLSIIAALPIVSMDLPIKLAPSSKRQLKTIHALAPSLNLLDNLSVPNTSLPVFSKSSDKYDKMIAKTARLHAVSPILVKSIIQAESNFNPKAVSKRGAVGLMQLMPSTAREMGINDPMDPEKNIVAGVRYLKELLVLFNDDERLAIAAYNCGPAAMKRWGKIPPYPETLNYVKRVMNYYNFHLS